MKKLLALLLILALAAILVESTPAPANAFEVPRVCAWAGYGPQWLTMCIVEMCLELGINPLGPQLI